MISLEGLFLSISTSFRSFISLSVNDFKNFINLTVSEKQLLLDKLFNLESVTQMGNIVSKLSKINDKDIELNNNEIYSLEVAITNIEDTIERIRINKLPTVDHTEEISLLLAKLGEYKPIHDDLKQKRTQLLSKVEEWRNDSGESVKLYTSIMDEINKVKKEIKLFDLDKCPTCRSDFQSENFSELRDMLNLKLNELEKTKLNIYENNNKLKNYKLKLDKISAKVNSSFDSVVNEVKRINKQINVLKKIDKTPEVDLFEFEKSIENNKKIIEDISVKNNILIKKHQCYKELYKLFGPDGVKRNIIASIIDPLNEFIQESMGVIDLPFQVKVNDSFDVSIYHMCEEIDHDTLSTGESRLVNIAILIAYLKLIRSKRSINVLFLDEIFSSVDTDNVDILLKLLGQFAKEYKINVFVVHHSIVSESFFDRIIKLEKNMFTTIIEEK